MKDSVLKAIITPFRKGFSFAPTQEHAETVLVSKKKNRTAVAVAKEDTLLSCVYLAGDVEETENHEGSGHSITINGRPFVFHTVPVYRAQIYIRESEKETLEQASTYGSLFSEFASTKANKKMKKYRHLDSITKDIDSIDTDLHSQVAAPKPVEDKEKKTEFEILPPNNADALHPREIYTLGLSLECERDNVFAETDIQKFAASPREFVELLPEVDSKIDTLAPSVISQEEQLRALVYLDSFYRVLNAHRTVSAPGLAGSLLPLQKRTVKSICKTFISFEEQKVIRKLHISPKVREALLARALVLILLVDNLTVDILRYSKLQSIVGLQNIKKILKMLGCRKASTSSVEQIYTLEVLPSSVEGLGKPFKQTSSPKFRVVR
ncbi:DNA-directed RNA polymerase I subunit RPA49 [Nematocida sp. AWRm77]|nr:DNA-directed RNA polymerase I subunit RPA49 [Nematocida sp. AWRm77]